MLSVSKDKLDLEKTYRKTYARKFQSFRFLLFDVSNWKCHQFCNANPVFRTKLNKSFSRIICLGMFGGVLGGVRVSFFVFGRVFGGVLQGCSWSFGGV